MIYLDNSATTPVCQEALDTYVKVSSTLWGNPSSRHSLGKEAEDVLKCARETVKTAIGETTGTVVFTAGGTEANNLAIFGRAYAKPRYLKGGKILTTQGEHASVTEPLALLRSQGFTVVEIPTTGGQIDREVLERELTPSVILVTMMLVNNETGAVYDLGGVSQMMRQKCPDAVLHVDATQGFLKIPFSPKSLGCDLLTISSHKVEGPKGVGALWISDPVKKNRGLVARELGGGQEMGYRSGTENVPAVAAFSAAIRKEMADRAARVGRIAALRGAMIERIQSDAAFSEVLLNLPPKAAPHILSLTLPKIKSETMLHFLSAKGVFVSSGSACSSHDTHTSPAMVAYGLRPEEADCTIRVSFGVSNTMEDVDAFLKYLQLGLETLVRIR